MKSVLVVVPTYEERDNLPMIIERVRTAVPHAHLLIVDDNSPDGTGRLAAQMAIEDDHIHVLHRNEKAGLGAAYVAGFRWALDRGYTVVVEMDADGSHHPEELPKLLARIDDADLVLGSRWTPGGKVVNWPKSRQLLSRGGNAYARLMLGVPVADVTGGFRAFRASALRRIEFDTVESQGYCFQIDLAWRTWMSGLRIVEVPITFSEREIGQSKMSGDIVREAMWRVTTWSMRTRRSRRHPLRVSPATAR